jgi:hypothetical protein
MFDDQRVAMENDPLKPLKKVVMFNSKLLNYKRVPLFMKNGGCKCE